MIQLLAMKKLIVLLTTLTIIFACKKEKKLKLPKIIASKYDTLIKSDLDKTSIANPIIYNINITSDSIIDLNRERKMRFKTGVFSDFEYFEAKKTDSIKLYVDTSNISLHSNLYGYTSIPPAPHPSSLRSDGTIIDEKVSNEYKSYIKSYTDYINKILHTHYEMIPVYIYNYSKNIQVVETPINGDLFLITEAKNEKGIWKPIEYFEQFGFLCGTGHQDFSLNPNHFIVAGVKKYSGSFKTKLRLKLNSLGRIFYSNSFDGSINKNQFNTTTLIKETRERFQSGSKERLKRKLDGLFVD